MIVLRLSEYARGYILSSMLGRVLCVYISVCKRKTLSDVYTLADLYIVVEDWHT